MAVRALTRLGKGFWCFSECETDRRSEGYRSSRMGLPAGLLEQSSMRVLNGCASKRRGMVHR